MNIGLDDEALSAALLARDGKVTSLSVHRLPGQQCPYIRRYRTGGCPWCVAQTKRELQFNQIYKRFDFANVYGFSPADAMRIATAIELDGIKGPRLALGGKP